MAFGREIFTPGFFRRLQQLRIETRRSYLGSRQGAHISKRKGHGLEFSDFRSYVPGDDFRHIDWGVYGRTDRLYIKEFREEQELQVLFLIDTSRSMAFPEGEGKFELARDLSVALAYVALADGDTTVLSFLGKELSPKYVGVRALPRLLELSRRVTPAGEQSLSTEVQRVLGKIRLPGKCFLISDLLMPIEEFVSTCEQVAAKNFELTVLQVLAPGEIDLKGDDSQSVLVDAESGETVELSLSSSLDAEYKKLLSRHVQDIERYTQKRGIGYALVSSESSVQQLVLNTLPELGILK
jgi:uncharacterized protein (DUF58 family)